jgi:regulatory protein
MPPSRKRHRPSAREAALKLIASRQLSELEVRARLERKGYDDAACADAVGMLKEYRYLDDAAAAATILQEATRVGRGPEWIRQTLARRGLDAALPARETRALEATAPARARELVRERFGEPAALPVGERRRAFRFLLGRGFSAECASDLLGEGC